MEEEKPSQAAGDFDGEFEIDTEVADEDLESAMQEALQAVEKANDGLKASGDGVLQGEDEESAPAMDTDSEIEKLEEEIVELRDRSARTLADFENFRKRVERERLVERRFAAFEVMGEFLAVLDNLERALASDGPADDLKTGVELIHRQMLEVMRNAGVSRITAMGEEFDPRFHEAVAHHEDPTVAVPTVSEELQPGYLMHDRLLRPSVVKVAMPLEGELAGGDDTAGSEARDG